MVGNQLVSIIMPAYNARNYIGEAIWSVLNQTYPCWELLVINDGSTDDTEREIKLFNDTRIKYFFQENKGVSAARNIGLANMRGNYFCFLDADDVMPPQSLESRLKIFFCNDEISFVDGQVLLKDMALQKVSRVYQPSFIGNPYQALLELSETCFLGNTWMIKRDRSREYQFKEGLTHSEDLLFYLNIAQQGLYATTSEEVLWYRTGNSSAMANLKGLEQGYASLYSEIKHNHCVSEKRIRYLKYKITRIMVLSYIRLQHDLGSAVRVLFRYAKL